MSFDARDLRRGKDVFDADDVYLGTVMWVATERGGETVGSPCHAPVSRDPGATNRAADALTTDRLDFSGEAIGPMPTASLGNTGPQRQSVSQVYATSALRPTSASPRHPATLIVVRLLTSLNWSTLRPRIRRIPVSAVQVVSHERIVLALAEADLE